MRELKKRCPRCHKRAFGLGMVGRLVVIQPCNHLVINPQMPISVALEAILTAEKRLVKSSDKMAKKSFGLYSYN